jgi:hypothetical protein
MHSSDSRFKHLPRQFMNTILRLVIQESKQNCPEFRLESDGCKSLAVTFLTTSGHDVIKFVLCPG